MGALRGQSTTGSRSRLSMLTAPLTNGLSTDPGIPKKTIRYTGSPLDCWAQHLRYLDAQYTRALGGHEPHIFIGGVVRSLLATHSVDHPALISAVGAFNKLHFQIKQLEGDILQQLDVCAHLTAAQGIAAKVNTVIQYLEDVQCCKILGMRWLMTSYRDGELEYQK